MSGYEVCDMGFGGLRICQAEDGFRYGIDAVLLAAFAAEICPGTTQAADLGCGNGAVALVLSHKLPHAKITGWELQEEQAELAGKSAEMNGLTDRFAVRAGDIRDIIKDPGEDAGAFDLVVTNPPYMKAGVRMVSKDPAKAVARHEVEGGLEDFLLAGRTLLKDKGHLCLIHRPSRLTDILSCARQLRMEPKTLRMVVPRRGESPNLVLLDLRKNAGSELVILPELAVYEGDGYSKEIMALYERQSG